MAYGLTWRKNISKHIFSVNGWLTSYWLNKHDLRSIVKQQNQQNQQTKSNHIHFQNNQYVYLVRLKIISTFEHLENTE